MAWLVGIDGDEADLAFLASAFDSDYLRVSRRYDQWYVGGSEITAATSSLQALAAGRTVIARLNGLARADDPHFRGVQIREVVINDEGTADHHVFVFGEAHLTMRATLGGDPAASLKRLSEQSQDDPSLAEAVRVLGAGGGWQDLWKAYEVLRAAAGGETSLRDRLQVTKTEVSRFTSGANDPRSSGDAARHAVPLGETPKTPPMTLDEARQFVSTLIGRWISTRDD